MSKLSKALRILCKFFGILITVAGVGFIVIACVDFFKCFNTEKNPDLYYFFFIGVGVLAVGCVLINIGFSKEIRSHAVNRAAKIINETKEKLNLPEQNNERIVNINKEEIVCDSCGEKNSANSKYCTKCGQQLSIECRYCQTLNNKSDKYCKNCGKRL